MRVCNFIDMFHGDDNEAIPDFSALKKQGILGVMHKVGGADRFIDPTYRERQKAARDAGMPWGGYWFMDGSHGVDQAKRFWDAANLAVGERACADYEFNKGRTGTASLPVLFDFVNTIDCEMTTLSNPCSRILLCMIYSSNLIRDTLSQEMSLASYFASHDLWLAEYGPHKCVPLPWTKARLWQFSETEEIGGITGHIDANYFDGDAAAFAEFWGLSSTR